MKKTIPTIAGIILILFGSATLFLSTSVLLDLFEIRAKEGNYVLEVVWSNFVASFFYILSGIGFLKLKLWTSKLLMISTVILLIGLIYLKWHITQGGLYEEKTVAAMYFRVAMTFFFTTIAYLNINKLKTN
jgi:hypothetical protein